MTKEILQAMIAHAEDVVQGGHFNITVRTTSGAVYNTWDEDFNLYENFVSIYDDDTEVLLPYSNIESIEI